MSVKKHAAPSRLASGGTPHQSRCCGWRFRFNRSLRLRRRLCTQKLTPREADRRTSSPRCRTVVGHRERPLQHATTHQTATCSTLTSPTYIQHSSLEGQHSRPSLLVPSKTRQFRVRLVEQNADTVSVKNALMFRLTSLPSPCIRRKTFSNKSITYQPGTHCQDVNKPTLSGCYL